MLPDYGRSASDPPLSFQRRNAYAMNLPVDSLKVAGTRPPAAQLPKTLRSFQSGPARSVARPDFDNLDQTAQQPTVLAEEPCQISSQTQNVPSLKSNCAQSMRSFQCGPWWGLGWASGEGGGYGAQGLA